LPRIPPWARNPAGFCLFALTFSSNVGEGSDVVPSDACGDNSASSDEPGQCNDGESDKCKRLREKIENLRKEIFDKRIPDLVNDPGGLPEYIGPGEKLRDTRRGHRKLLDRQWRRLRELEDRYEKECLGK
jgi:hypothetical protein